MISENLSRFDGFPVFPKVASTSYVSGSAHPIQISHVFISKPGVTHVSSSEIQRSEVLALRISPARPRDVVWRLELPRTGSRR